MTNLYTKAWERTVDQVGAFLCSRWIREVGGGVSIVVIVFCLYLMAIAIFGDRLNPLFKLWGY